MNAGPTDTIRLLLVDDHTLFRESLARLLQSEPGFEVVAHCSSVGGSHAHPQPGRNRHRLIGSGFGDGKRSRPSRRYFEKLALQGKVLLVTAGVNEREMPSLIRKGISGIFMKHNPPACSFRESETR